MAVGARRRGPYAGPAGVSLLLLAAAAAVYVAVQPRGHAALVQTEASDDWVSVGKEKAKQLKAWLGEVKSMEGEVRKFQSEANSKAVSELVRLGRVNAMLEVMRKQVPLDVEAPPAAEVAQVEPAAKHWGYGDGADGPAHWGDLSSEWVMCKAGQQQSPINLGPDVVEHKMPALGWFLGDKKTAVKDHVGTSTAEGREFYNGHTFEVEDLGSPTLLLDGTEYTLEQFHFHTPSEHTVEGRRFDMEMHLVHSAVVDGSKELAVVSVLFSKGARSPQFIKGLFQESVSEATDAPASLVPKFSFRDVAESVLVGAIPDQLTAANSFIPNFQNYVRYDGSLTSPPCSEGVKWVVLRNDLHISSADLLAVSTKEGANSRPTQALNDRAVEASTKWASGGGGSVGGGSMAW